MKKLTLITAAFMLMFAVACEKSPMRDMQPSDTIITDDMARPAPPIAGPPIIVTPGFTTMSMYFGGQMYTVKFREIFGTEAEEMLSRTECISSMYVAPALHAAEPYWFFPVMDKIYPQFPFAVYVEKKIIYGNHNVRPHQFTSGEDILKAVSGHGSGISVQPNGKVVLVTFILRQPKYPAE